MKWLFFALVLVNVSFYLWATGHPQNSPDVARAAQSPVNARGMLLLGEREAAGVAGGRVCMRIGPFLTQATFADASRVLGDMGLRYAKTAVSARKLKTWRVYTDVPADKESVDALRDKLDEMGVDHYQFDDNGASFMSVGLFSQSGDARRYVTRLKESGVEAIYRPELRTLGPLRWIEVEKVPDRYAREQLEAVQWGDAMASVTSFPCDG
ncbi:MAG: hypothetical protein DWQ08_04875 [Proteobacteria bacterium]|nr:MAG: hypothetical protein DWQ08_04875 [Pseudomonadota bacterium]